MTLNEFKAWLKEKMPENFRENEPMQAHTSFRIGGPADLLILPADVHQLEEAVAKAKKLAAEASNASR